jgi:hypothetical protein
VSGDEKEIQTEIDPGNMNTSVTVYVIGAEIQAESESVTSIDSQSESESGIENDSDCESWRVVGKVMGNVSGVERAHEKDTVVSANKIEGVHERPSAVLR